ncbi:MAG TPA: arginine deiminase-related protein [Candidatus Binataceae bacterium]|nr:arginine deiminase-related protein [Candidatus Binataceae bacterium]
MPRTILMGDPAYFSVLGGANPHTRNALGLRKKVDPTRARVQWHALARALVHHGVEVCVIEAHPRLSGLVYPANAGFRFPLEARGDAAANKFFLSNLIPTRQGEREIYRPFLRAMGYETIDVAARFEGEADFFPAADSMIFTHGRVERQRFVPRLGLPPWKRRYGFRSEIGALGELRAIVAPQRVLSIELALEAHYHGDTVLCSFGPHREYLLVYMEGLSPASRDLIRAQFGNDLIGLTQSDAEFYAANSFQTDHDGRLYLFMPEGVSAGLQREIQARGVEPVLVNVSEFLAKGGGSIKCMILDLGPSAEQPADPAAVAFRAERCYLRLFGSSV